MTYNILTTEQYDEWFESQDARSVIQIAERLRKIVEEGYFGKKRNVSKNEKGILKNRVWEIKFNDGRRIYFSIIPTKNLFLLLGGNKNGQDYDIKKAKAIFLKSTEPIDKKTTRSKVKG